MEQLEKPENTAGRKANLLFVTSSLYFGGAQKVTFILADALADQYNVTVAYCFDAGRNYPFHNKCTVRKLPDYDRNAGVMEKVICIGKQVRTLRALKEELKTDVSVSLGNLSNYLNAMSKGREYVICSERSNPSKSWQNLFFLTKRAFRRADYVVFQSEAVRNLFAESVRRKSCILKNPVLIPGPAGQQRTKKIVTLGRLTAQKNHALLIRSFARFRQSHPGYELYIYGDGELKAQLRQLIDSLGLSSCVFLEGNDPQVHDHIRDAEMFVLSSDYEGLSNALLECMAMGIACVSTACEGSVDVIRSGENGLLVPLHDEAALAAAMGSFADDPELRRRLENQAYEDMKAYDKAIVTKDWEQVIRKGIAER